MSTQVEQLYYLEYNSLAGGSMVAIKVKKLKLKKTVARSSGKKEASSKPDPVKNRIPVGRAIFQQK